MTAWAIAVVVATGGLLVALAVVLARQGSPAKLSEEPSTTRSPQPYVVDRPAGPGAEAMGVSRPGRPSTTPDRDDERPGTTPEREDERPSTTSEHPDVTVSAQPRPRAGGGGVGQEGERR